MEYDPETGDVLEDFNDYPYVGVLQMLKKRSHPRFHHAFVYRNPSYRTSPIAQSKRFLPFHPLARFRGLSMGGAGGGLVGVGAPYRQDGFETYVSDSNTIPSPGHPVPSGETKAAETGEDLGENEKIYSGDPQVSETKEKINAGELLQYLNNFSSGRGLGSKAKIFRFGIK
ncbi:hypothetical protein Avbf_04925 [Armadillidium vulgare]|nr:hypothetical protein Avbf_04925 [Armadillidium vulgare]